MVAVGRVARRLDRVVVDLRAPASTGSCRRRGTRRSARSRGRAASGRTGPTRSTPQRGARCHLPTAYVRVAVVAEDAVRASPPTAGCGRCTPGKPNGELGQQAHADRVVVATGEQARAGRRAQRGDVEAVVAQPAARRGASMFGVAMSEPKQPSCANPRSSSTITSTFGPAVRPRGGDGSMLGFWGCSCRVDGDRHLGVPAHGAGVQAHDARRGRPPRSGSAAASPRSRCVPRGGPARRRGRSGCRTRTTTW